MAPTNSPGSFFTLNSSYQFPPWGDNNEVHELSHQAGLHSLWFLAAPHSRHIYWSLICLSLKLVIARRIGRMQVPHNAAPDTKKEVGKCSLVLLLVFQLSHVQQQFSKCSFFGRMQYLRIIQMVRVLPLLSQLPSRPVLECPRKQEVLVLYIAGLASCPGILLQCQCSLSSFCTWLSVLTRGANPHRL